MTWLARWLLRWRHMDDDSIDGLGLTIGDIANGNAAAIAQFRLTKKIERRLNEVRENEVRQPFMNDMHVYAYNIIEAANDAANAFDKIGRS